MKEFMLPDVGEGLTEAEIVAWKVARGDNVEVNDILVEIETAKSLVELPSPYSGTVSSILVDEGHTVEVGTALVRIDERRENLTEQNGDDAQKVVTRETVEHGDTAQDLDEPQHHEERDEAQSLVGTGPKADRVLPRRKRGPVASGEEDGKRASGTSALLSTPPVRKMAKDLGVDLEQVVATGRRGEVTRSDLVEHVARDRAETSHMGEGEQSAKASRDRIERIPVRGLRKATAKAVVKSAFDAPHVSVFVDVDASRTMEFVKRLREGDALGGVKVSPLLVLAKAVLWAVARNPQVNATWAGDEILVKHYVNLGIAAATPRGLIVPNIKNAQDLSLRDLAHALNHLAVTARSGKTSPQDTQGGTLTITNIGVLGIDTGTPILNPGEVAIVAFGTVKQKPWVLDGEVLPRWVTTLGGSFDHRVVDGDLSARFIADVASVLEEPALLLD